MSEFAIKVENLSKIYEIGKEQSGSLRETLSSFNPFSKAQEKESFAALNNVSFEVKPGEAVAIVGKNGAGKSTLLKILSRITEPTKGKIEINGRISSLLEVGTGFHPELTGRENVFLNGTILGMTRSEVKSKFEEIVEFSGVQKFIDTPVKHYSSGMYVRLAFAVAAHLEPEILIIDEVLAVGDAEFQKKCLGKMGEVAGQGRTVLFVSHNMGAVKNLCSSGVILNKGEVKVVSNDINEIINHYLNLGDSDQLSSNWKKPISEDILNKTLSINEVSLLNQNMEMSSSFLINQNVLLEIKLSILKPTKGFRIGLQVTNYDGVLCFTSNDYSLLEKDLSNGIYEVSCEIPANLLNVGAYQISLAIDIPKVEILSPMKKYLKFETIDGDKESIFPNANKGILRPKLNWSINQKQEIK